MPTPAPNTYPLDPSGVNVTNKVENELHTLTAVNDRTYHLVIPDFAPFYEDGFIIEYRANSGQSFVVLEKGTDYYFTLRFVAASIATAKAIYGGVSFLNLDLAGEIRISQYQTVGGEWTLGVDKLTELMANIIYNPLTTTWEVLANVPTQFPPQSHNYDLSTLRGMGDVYDKLADIETALLTVDPGGSLAQHILNLNNPHKTDKNAVKLGFVQNYPVATIQEAIDARRADRYLTPIGMWHFFSGNGNLPTATYEEVMSQSYVPKAIRFDHLLDFLREYLNLQQAGGLPQAAPLIISPLSETNYAIAQLFTCNTFDPVPVGVQIKLDNLSGTGNYTVPAGVSEVKIIGKGGTGQSNLPQFVVRTHTASEGGSTTFTIPAGGSSAIIRGRGAAGTVELGSPVNGLNAVVTILGGTHTFSGSPTTDEPTQREDNLFLNPQASTFVTISSPPGTVVEIVYQDWDDNAQWQVKRYYSSKLTNTASGTAELVEDTDGTIVGLSNTATGEWIKDRTSFSTVSTASIPVSHTLTIKLGDNGSTSTRFIFNKKFTYLGILCEIQVISELVNAGVIDTPGPNAVATLNLVSYTWNGSPNASTASVGRTETISVDPETTHVLTYDAPAGSTLTLQYVEPGSGGFVTHVNTQWQISRTNVFDVADILDGTEFAAGSSYTLTSWKPTRNNLLSNNFYFVRMRWLKSNGGHSDWSSINRFKFVSTTVNPGVGDLLGTFCSGTGNLDLWGRYADGFGGEYTQLIQANSVECGYVAPALGTLTSSTVSTSVIRGQIAELTFSLTNIINTNVVVVMTVNHLTSTAGHVNSYSYQIGSASALPVPGDNRITIPAGQTQLKIYVETNATASLDTEKVFSLGIGRAVGQTAITNTAPVYNNVTITNAILSAAKNQISTLWDDLGPSRLGGYGGSNYGEFRNYAELEGPRTVFTRLGLTGGKHYVVLTISKLNAEVNPMVGIGLAGSNRATYTDIATYQALGDSGVGSSTDTWGINLIDGKVYYRGASISNAPVGWPASGMFEAGTFTPGYNGPVERVTIGVALDLDTKTMTLYKNNVAMRTFTFPYADGSVVHLAAGSFGATPDSAPDGSNRRGITVRANFGDPFFQSQGGNSEIIGSSGLTVPSGFKAGLKSPTTYVNNYVTNNKLIAHNANASTALTIVKNTNEQLGVYDASIGALVFTPSEVNTRFYLEGFEYQARYDSYMELDFELPAAITETRTLYFTVFAKNELGNIVQASHVRMRQLAGQSSASITVFPADATPLMLEVGDGFGVISAPCQLTGRNKLRVSVLRLLYPTSLEQNFGIGRRYISIGANNSVINQYNTAISLSGNYENESFFIKIVPMFQLSVDLKVYELSWHDRGQSTAQALPPPPPAPPPPPPPPSDPFGLISASSYNVPFGSGYSVTVSFGNLSAYNGQAYVIDIAGTTPLGSAFSEPGWASGTVIGGGVNITLNYTNNQPIYYGNNTRFATLKIAGATVAISGTMVVTLIGP